MKLTVIFIGKTGKKNLEQEICEYLRRLNHYAEINIIEISGIRLGAKLKESEIREKEGVLVLAKLKETDYLILLDERGKEMTSSDFAKTIGQWQNRSIKNAVFLIGGAYGFSEKVYLRANFNLSLSQMTFSHQMARLIFMEQLYRAYTILKGEPYHHV